MAARALVARGWSWGEARVLAPLCLLALGDAFGYAVILPLLPLLAERHGLPTLAIGALFGLYSLCQFAAAPMLGALGDRFGLKRVLLVCQAGTAAGFALLWAPSPPVLFLSRLVDGATAGNVALLYGGVLRGLPRARRRAGFAALGSATSAGILAGLLAASIVAVRGFAAIVGLAVGCSLALLVVTAIVFPPLGRGGADAAGAGLALRRLPALLNSGALRLLLLVVLLATALQSAFLTTLPLIVARLLGYREAEINRLLLALFLAAALCQVVVLGLLARRAAARDAALVAFGAAVAGGLLYALAPAGAIPYTAALAMGGCALLGPALAAIVGRASSPAREGALMGLNQGAVSLGQLAGPVAGYALLAAESTVPSRLLPPALGALCLTLLLSPRLAPLVTPEGPHDHPA